MDSTAATTLQVEWDQLASNFANPLLTTDWFSSSIDTFCPPNKLNMVAVKRAGKLSALAPLSLKGRLLPRLELIGSSTLMEPGGLLYQDRESLLQLIRTMVSAGRPLFLKGLQLFSAEVEILEKELQNGTFTTFVSEERIPFVETNISWEEFEKRYVSSSRRSSFRRLQRKAEEYGKIQFEVVVPTPENLEHYLAIVYRIEAANWKGREGTAMKTHATIGKFFQLYSQRAAQNGNLHLFFLRVGNQIVATQITVIHANRLWIFKTGFDEDWSWCSPGILLMHKVIEFCFEEGLDGCEFLGSDESWLHIWANGFHNLVTYYIFPKSAKGLLHRFLMYSKSFYHDARFIMRRKYSEFAYTYTKKYDHVESNKE